MLSTEPDKQEVVLTLDVPIGYREEARIDVYLTRHLPNATRTKVQRGIKQGRVTVNGCVVSRPSHAVQSGDRIECRVLQSPPIEAAPESIPIEVIHEDQWLLVINKAAGMVVHPAYGNRTGTLVNALLHHVGSAGVTVDSLDDDDTDTGLSTAAARPISKRDPSIRPGIVHRIDKQTSGLLVVAKDDTTHAALAQQFAERSTRRDYIGLVFRVPAPKGTIEGAIGRDRRDRKKMAIVSASKGKHAVTHFETLEAFSDAAVLRFRLETGRTHQIRVHAASTGNPIIGDQTYGGTDLKRLVASRKRRAFYRNVIERLGRHALHARSLGFVHPGTGKEVMFETDLPEDMQTALQQLRAHP